MEVMNKLSAVEELTKIASDAAECFRTEKRFEFDVSFELAFRLYVMSGRVKLVGERYSAFVAGGLVPYGKRAFDGTSVVGCTDHRSIPPVIKRVPITETIEEAMVDALKGFEALVDDSPCHISDAEMHMSIYRFEEDKPYHRVTSSIAGSYHDLAAFERRLMRRTATVRKFLHSNYRHVTREHSLGSIKQARKRERRRLQSVH